MAVLWPKFDAAGVYKAQKVVQDPAKTQKIMMQYTPHDADFFLCSVWLSHCLWPASSGLRSNSDIGPSQQDRWRHVCCCKWDPGLRAGHPLEYPKHQLLR